MSWMSWMSWLVLQLTSPSLSDGGSYLNYPAGSKWKHILSCVQVMCWLHPLFTPDDHLNVPHGRRLSDTTAVPLIQTSVFVAAMSLLSLTVLRRGWNKNRTQPSPVLNTFLQSFSPSTTEGGDNPGAVDVRPEVFRWRSVLGSADSCWRWDI